MNIKPISGAALAAAALTLAVSAAMTVPAAAKSDSKVMCYGVNSCKGQGACKSASNSCAGLNSCKGLGWISTTEANCNKWGGKII